MRQSFFRRSFDINDKDGDCVLVMKDNKQKFQILTPQGLEIGQADLEMPDRLKLNFPQEMDVRIKAVLLGSILSL